MDKKKLAIIGAVVVVLIGVIVGVVIGVNSNKEPEPEEAPKVVDEKAFSINGLNFRLDTEKEFEGAKYEISKDFAEAKHDLYSHYVEYKYLQKDDTNLLFFRIFHYTDKDMAAAAADLGIENPTYEDGKTDNFEYKIYKEPRDDGTIHFYFIEKDGGTYVLHIVSKYDIEEFETKVLKTIKF